MKEAVNIAEDERAIEAVKLLSAYCKDKPLCDECFMYNHPCILHGMPEEWAVSLSEMMVERAEVWKKKNTEKSLKNLKR